MSRLAPSRELLFLAGTFGLLLLVAVLVPRQEEKSQEGLPALSTYATGDPGGALLYRWLGQLGYAVERLERRAFRLEERASVLFVLAPTYGFNRTQGEEVERFVRDGGTAIYVGDEEARSFVPVSVGVRPGTRGETLSSRFGLRVEPRSPIIRSARPSLALLQTPAVAETTVNTRSSISWEGIDAVPLLSADGSVERVVMVSLRVGKGRLIVLSAPHLLSNKGLREADNWRVVLNLLPEPGSGVVLFDEYHHGLVADETLESVVWKRPWGWAGLGATVLVLGFLALRGRRFGRALALSRAGRRAPAEYVHSVATLLRRGRHQVWVRRHYASQLRGAARRRLGIEGDLAQRLGVGSLVMDDVRAEDLLAVLETLESGRRLKEDDLVRLVQKAEEMRARLEGRGR